MRSIVTVMSSYTSYVRPAVLTHFEMALQAATPADNCQEG
jgi:hypothetical protein